LTTSFNPPSQTRVLIISEHPNDGRLGIKP